MPRRPASLPMAAASCAVVAVALAVTLTESGGPDPGGVDVPAGTRVTDATGTIEVGVPATWADVDDTAAGGRRPAVAAAPDLDAFRRARGGPGVEVSFDTGRGRGDVDAAIAEAVDHAGAGSCAQAIDGDLAEQGFDGRLVSYDCGAATVAALAGTGPGFRGLLSLVARVERPGELTLILSSFGFAG